MQIVFVMSIDSLRADEVEQCIRSDTCMVGGGRHIALQPGATARMGAGQEVWTTAGLEMGEGNSFGHRHG